jgi:hypothetical protein
MDRVRARASYKEGQGFGVGLNRAKCAESTSKHGIDTSNPFALALHVYALMMDVAEVGDYFCANRIKLG